MTQDEGLSLDKPFDVLRWVRDRCNWPPNAKLCYLVLYSHRNGETGFAYPSLKRLAAGLGLTPKGAIAAVRMLEAVGAVQVIRRHEPDSKEAAVNLYRLAAPWEAVQVFERKARGTGGGEVVTQGNKVVPNGNNLVYVGNDGCSKSTQGVVTVGNSNKPMEQAHENALHQEEAPATKTTPESVFTWRKWYEQKFGGRWPRSESATVLDNAAAAGMSPDVIIRAIEQGLIERRRDPLSWAAYLVGNMLAAGVRTMADAEEFERAKAHAGKGLDKPRGGKKFDVIRADSPTSKWEVVN
ncbi:MAG: helix-turn-helix domain-containing protein [Chitinophagales bacterium]